jgi:hypothetical protein
MISDNDLLLYHYGDGLDADERAHITAALRTQPELAARLNALVAQLDAAASTPELPVPMHVQQRWQTALDHAARERATDNRSSFNPLRWQAVATAAVILVVIAIGVRFGRDAPRDPPDVAQDRSPAPAQIAANESASNKHDRGMRWHLASTERQINDLQHASGTERAVLIDAVIAQNRLYAIAAERSGDERLARALRSFTPILENLADSPLNNGAADGGLAQLNFELRVMQARLATAPDSSNNPRAPLDL